MAEVVSGNPFPFAIGKNEGIYLIKMKDLKLIVCDADDTLWSNEPLFRNAERELAETLKAYGSEDEINAELFKTEMSNMSELGYGAKAFILSAIETAVRVSGGRVSADELYRIEQSGRKILRNPALPLPGVEETLSKIRKSGKYKLAILTKGELLDQNNKIDRSGLRKYFDYIEVLRDKTPDVYYRVCNIFGVKTSEMLMVGNSFRSDIDPVLKVGGYGVYIPSDCTWQHEIIEEYDHSHLFRAAKFDELISLLGL